MQWPICWANIIPDIDECIWITTEAPDVGFSAESYSLDKNVKDHAFFPHLKVSMTQREVFDLTEKSCAQYSDALSPVHIVSSFVTIYMKY